MRELPANFCLWLRDELRAEATGRRDPTGRPARTIQVSDLEALGLLLLCLERQHQDRPHQDRPHQDRPHQERPHQDRPHQDRPHQDRPGPERPGPERPGPEEGLAGCTADIAVQLAVALLARLNS